MNEVKELFDKVALLSEFDDKSLQDLIELRNKLNKFIKQVEIAKRDGYYFQIGPEMPLYMRYREKTYDEIFSVDEKINADCLSYNLNTEEKVFSLNRKLNKLNNK